MDDLLIVGKRALNDALIDAVQQVWKTSAPEHLGPDPVCVLVLHFLGKNLERVNNNRSRELDLLVGTTLINQLEYIVEQLKSL